MNDGYLRWWIGDWFVAARLSRPIRRIFHATRRSLHVGPLTICKIPKVSGGVQ